MKRIQLSLLSLLTLTVVQAQTKNFIDMPYLEVAGHADSLVAPDEIHIRIYVSEKNAKERLSLEEQEAKMYQSFKTIGVNTDKDLSIRNMGSSLRQHLFKGGDVLKSRHYILKVANAAMAGKVFEQLEKLDIADAGVESVGHSKMEHIRNLLRSAAVANARERAVALTKPLGQSVGAAIHLEDHEVYPQTENTKRRGEEVIYKMRSDKSEASDGFQDIEFEKIKVSANIKAQFMLRS
jgi:uncharacterized protein YggE